jgi:hypothetical protein
MSSKTEIDVAIEQAELAVEFLKGLRLRPAGGTETVEGSLGMTALVGEAASQLLRSVQTLQMYRSRVRERTQTFLPEST